MAEETPTIPSGDVPMTTGNEGGDPAPAEVIDTPTTYADGKFTSVGDLEKSYGELQSSYSKKLGGFDGAPEAYEFAEGSVSEKNQGLADMLGEWGLDNQLSNDGINSLITKYSEFEINKHDASIDAELLKLGDDGQARITNAKNYLEANLGVEATEALAANMNTAGAIEAIEKLIGLNKTRPPAELGAESHVNADKIHEMRFALDDNGNRKMEDPAYRQRVLRLEQGQRG